MWKTMKQKTLQELDDDEILARDLVNSAGAVILAKGVKVSSSMKVVLGKMGVDSVCVESGDTADTGLWLKNQLELLEMRFRNCDDNAFLNEMKQIATDHLKEA
jgi:hypothetical protein